MSFLGFLKPSNSFPRSVVAIFTHTGTSARHLTPHWLVKTELRFWICQLHGTGATTTEVVAEIVAHLGFLLFFEVKTSKGK